VIKNGKKVNPRDYFEVERVGWDRTITYLSVDPDTQKKYGLNTIHAMVNFGLDHKFHKIVYDNSKAVFFKNGEEPMVKDLKNLSEEQFFAIQALKLPPPPYMGKIKVIQAIVDSWTDPKQFGVWIDDVRIKNNDMTKYSATDFPYHYVNELQKNAKNYGQYRYQLSLISPEKFEKDRIRSIKNQKDWEQTTKELLAKLNF
jgi:hypothetical protein